MEPPEIRKGDFVYRDTLFVDLGSNRRHPRASPAELKDLLLPKSGSAPKDQVAHWYEAQLLHYGLPRSKDKNTAKVRLTNAITAKNLLVPKEVVSMEAEMKKDYAGALRKMKSPGGKVAGTKEKKESAAASKAKKSTSKTTVELEIDGMKLKIDRETIDAAKKKSSKAKEKEATSKPKGAKASTSKPKSAAAMKSSPAKPAAARSSPLKPASTASAPRPKQTARRGQSFSHSTSSRPASSPAQTHDHTPYSFRHDVDMDDAPPAYESHDFTHHSDDSSNSSGRVQISGTYFFPRPPVQPFSLALQKDHHTQKFWGRFQIGSKEGVIRIDDTSRIASGDAVSFGWRSEDQNDGFMKFGRGCDGTMAFDGEGWARGTFKGLLYGEHVDFEGSLVNEDGCDVEEMKGVWDDFPRKAYGRGRG